MALLRILSEDKQGQRSKFRSIKEELSNDDLSNPYGLLAQCWLMLGLFSYIMLCKAWSGQCVLLGIPVIILITFVVYIILMILYFVRMQQKAVAILPRIKEIEGSQSVVLLMALYGRVKGEETKAEIKSLLIHSLPTLQKVDVCDISRRSLLYQDLCLRNEEFTIVVLQTIERFGWIDAWPYVSRIAKQSKVSTQHTLIYEAAESCLKALQHRTDNKDASEILLRPSLPATLPDVLLRPASGVTQATSKETAQLLRPAGDQENASSASIPVLPISQPSELPETDQSLRLGHSQEQYQPE